MTLPTTCPKCGLPNTDSTPMESSRGMLYIMYCNDCDWEDEEWN